MFHKNSSINNANDIKAIQSLIKKKYLKGIWSGFVWKDTVGQVVPDLPAEGPALLLCWHNVGVGHENSPRFSRWRLVCKSIPYLLAESSPVALSWRFKCFPELLILEILGHWVCLLYGLLTHHWSDEGVEFGPHVTVASKLSHASYVGFVGAHRDSLSL